MHADDPLAFCEALKLELQALDAFGRLECGAIPAPEPPGFVGVATTARVLAADIVAPALLAPRIATWLGAATRSEPGSAAWSVGGAAVQVYPCEQLAPDEWHLVPRGRGCYPFHVLANDVWRNQPCLVVGGGESVRGFDWEAHRGGLAVMRVIAASRAGDDIPAGVDVDIWLSADRPFWERGRKRPGTLRVYVGPPDDPSIGDVADRQLAWHGHQWNWEPPPMLPGVACCGNSGHAAVSLALGLGATPVYLLGFDCAPGVWVSATGRPPRGETFRRWRAGLLRLAAWAAERGQLVRWINSGAAAPEEVLRGA